MSKPINTSVGERVTFRGLFERHDLVEIPIIQRDYAQGRLSKLETEIRSDFVRALYKALAKPAADPSLPLDLDFVYGSVENAGRTAFCPLDGQQRLTTLFLLHWYLAWKDQKFDDLATFVRAEQKPRFSYAVHQAAMISSIRYWHGHQNCQFRSGGRFRRLSLTSLGSIARGNWTRRFKPA